MSARSARFVRRRLRKLVGVECAYDFLSFRRRGFFGRMKWLLFGR